MDVGTIKEYYKKGLDYFNQMRFISTWKEAEDFKKGKQWPRPTEKTKNMPRPVINIIRYIENYKVSQILSEPITMVFSPRDAEYSQDDTSMLAAEIFSQYSELEWDNVRQDDLNEEALDRASDIGSGIYHYYYDDSTISGLNTIVKGELKGEILHPVNVFVGNPQSLDTQTQPYILISVRDDVKAIRDRAKVNGVSVEDIAKIKGDKDTTNEGSNNSNYEINDKATEITCYYKENGTVHLMKICGDVVTMQDVDTGHTLYPIARMNWYKDDKNWYGYGDTTDLIPNQKSINFITAMRMMAEQYGGMPKLMLKKGMIDNFSNDPSVPIYDNSSVGWSATYLQPTYNSARGQELVDFMLSATKTHTGATETSTGELAKSSQMNATAIMMLQKASSVPLDQVKRRFKRTIEEVGEIWREFWTINYNTNRVMQMDNAQGESIMQAWRGTDFKDSGLKLKIDVGASSDYSESLTMTTLDKLHDSKEIDTKTYIQLAPENIVPFKEQLLKILDQQQASGMNGQAPNLTPEEQQTLSQLPPDKQAMVMQQLQSQGNMMNSQNNMNNSNNPTPQM